MPKIWSSLPPKADKDYVQHKDFLKEFLQQVLPIEPFIDKPKEIQLELLQESFDHYWGVAQQSSHRHIDKEEVLDFKKRYLELISKITYDDLHFTHGHLSGLDIVYDTSRDQYTVMGNLYWKWRPKYWELTFPTWNSLMHIRDKNLTFDNFLNMVDRWIKLGSTDLYNHDPEI